MAEDDELDAQPSGLRSFWTGTITFGLVTVPVALYSATRSRCLPTSPQSYWSSRSYPSYSPMKLALHRGDITRLAVDAIKAGEIDLADQVFGAEVKEQLFYDVVKAQLASRRAGTQSAIHGR